MTSEKDFHLLPRCISNREDKFALTNFVKALKQQVGSLVPKWFMSNLTKQFYNAWVATFGNRPNKLVCTWHVNHAWKENLHQLKNYELKANVYHNLRVLLEEQDKDTFEILLDLTLIELSKSSVTDSFLNFFEIHYAKNKEWAACYRKGTLLNTNMFVEAYHRVLKYLYMEGKVNKRMDKCIFVLLKLARDNTSVFLFY